jgi:hypothetical protein
MRITFAVAAILIVVALAIAVGSRALAARQGVPANAAACAWGREGRAEGVPGAGADRSCRP